MRVLFVTHNIPRFSGDVAGSFVLRLARALTDRGVTVDVIAPATNEQVGDDIVDGIRIRRVRYAADMTIAYGGTMAEAVASSNRGRLAFVGLFRALRKAAITFVNDVDLARLHTSSRCTVPTYAWRAQRNSRIHSCGVCSGVQRS